MTKLPHVLLCALLLVPASAAWAENPTPTPAAGGADAFLDANYVVTLAPVEKDGAGFAVITAATHFGVSNTEARLVFNGVLSPQKDGSFRLDYRLTNDGGGLEAVASVYLRVGEPIQVVKNGKQFYNLRLDRYPPPSH